MATITYCTLTRRYWRTTFRRATGANRNRSLARLTHIPARARTAVEATSASYDSLVSGLVRKEYSADRVEAITLNKLGSNAERQSEFDAEFAELEAYRTTCKALVREILSRTI